MDLTKEELKIVENIFAITDGMTEVLLEDEPFLLEDLTDEVEEPEKIAKQLTREYLRCLYLAEGNLLTTQGLKGVTRETLGYGKEA